jgi:hypothetical protein
MPVRLSTHRLLISVCLPLLILILFYTLIITLFGCLFDSHQLSATWAFPLLYIDLGLLLKGVFIVDHIIIDSLLKAINKSNID